MATGLPRVTIQPTRDLTYRVPPRGGTGVGCIVVNARKGPVDEPVFVANETEYLRTFCPDETISVGDDEAHYSALNFLREGAGLWVVRPSPNGVYAALRVGTDNPGNYGLTTGAGTERRSGSSADNSTVTLEDLLAAPDMPNDDGNIYTIFAKSPGKWGNNISVAFAETEDDTLDLPSLDFRKTLGDLVPRTFTISDTPASLQRVYLPNNLTTGDPIEVSGSNGGVYRTANIPSTPGLFRFHRDSGMFEYYAHSTDSALNVSFPESWSSSATVTYAADVPAMTEDQIVILPDGTTVGGITHNSGTPAVPTDWQDEETVDGAGDYKLVGTQFHYWTTAVGVASVDLGPSVTFTGGGTGARAVATVGANGTITGVRVLHGGSGYSSAPTVVFGSGGGGTGASGTATVSGNAVTGVNVSNAGSGYTTPTIKIRLTHIDQAGMLPANNAFAGYQISDVRMEQTTTFAATETDGLDSLTVTTGAGQWEQTNGELLLRYDSAEEGTLSINIDFDLNDITLTPTGTGLGALDLPTDSVIEDVTSINLANNVGRLTVVPSGYNRKSNKSYKQFKRSPRRG